MMNANEFRIGNIVWHPQVGEIEVTGIRDNCGHTAFDTKTGWVYMHNCKPIDLTEKVFFKYGFKPSHNLGSRRFYSIGKFVVENSLPSIGVYYTNGELVSFIDSLHELQNLFYSLTRKELTSND